MIQHIAQNPARVTHHTHEQVFQDLDLATPTQMLLALAVKRRDTIHNRVRMCSEHDVLRHLDHSNLHHLINHLILPSPQPAPLPGDLIDQISVEARRCPLCSFTSRGLPTLKRHCTTEHNLTQYSLNHIDFYQDCVQGLPQCSKCMQTFVTWRSFKKHVRQRICEAPSMMHFCGQRQLHRDPDTRLILPGLTFEHQRFLCDRSMGNKLARHIHPISQLESVAR